MDETLRSLIIEELSLTNASNELIDQTITTIGRAILESLVISVADRMDDATLEAFESVIATHNQEKIMEFLAKHVPDLDVILSQTSKEVIERYKKL